MSKVIKGIQVPQRADFVGSFLRPQNLSDSTRNQLVRELTDKQKQLGYHVITDGEFYRASGGGGHAKRALRGLCNYATLCV